MTAIAAFTLTSPSTQTEAPFLIGHAFKKGDVPVGQNLHVDAPHYAITPLRYWNDGSIKHVAIMGRVNLVATVAKQFNIVANPVTAPVGTVLTAADIEAAAPTASITLGAFGTVSLAPLLASPRRTFLSTKEMVECHYGADVGADQSLYVRFHVRLFASGEMFIRVTATNAYLNNPVTKVTKSYIPEVTINGSVVWDNGGIEYTHGSWTRYDVTGWIGGDPQITPRHDTTYLNQTKMVPNYWKLDPANTLLTTYESDVYTPGAYLKYRAYMQSSGYHEQIGLLPGWDAFYCTSRGVKTMYDSVVNHARAINSYQIILTDAATGEAPKITAHPNRTVLGNYGGGTVTLTTPRQGGDVLTWDRAHFPSAGYLAYILTADFYYYESAYFNGICPHWCESAGHGGPGLLRAFTGQNRSRGWAFRSMAQACSIMPDNMDADHGELKLLLATMMNTKKVDHVDNPSPASWLGIDHLMNNRSDGSGSIAPNGEICAETAMWEHHFNTMSLGMASDIEPLDATGMVDLNAYKDYLLNAAVWILGGDGVDEYNFGYLGKYTTRIRMDTPSTGTFSSVNTDRLIPTNPGMIAADTMSTNTVPFVNGPNNSILTQSYLATDYLANALPAIAYAVDHAKPGAAEGWARFIGADNFSTSENAGYDAKPVWGIVPRSYVQPSAVFSPIDTISVPAAVGRTIRIGDLFADKITIGECGQGVLASEIPSTGTSGPSYLYEDTKDLLDKNIECRGVIITRPAEGKLTTFEDGSFIYEDAPDGVHTFTYDTYLGNTLVKSNSLVVLHVGEHTITSTQAPQNSSIVVTGTDLSAVTQIVSTQAGQHSNIAVIATIPSGSAAIASTQAGQSSSITVVGTVPAGTASIVSTQVGQHSSIIAVNSTPSIPITFVQYSGRLVTASGETPPNLTGLSIALYPTTRDMQENTNRVGTITGVSVTDGDFLGVAAVANAGTYYMRLYDPLNFSQHAFGELTLTAV
jgi:hypothetical protein